MNHSELNNMPPSEILRNIEIFSNLGEEKLSHLYTHMRHRSFPAGSRLFNEGDPGEELFVIIKGSVSIIVNIPDGKELVISEIGEGNFFGEMSIIEQAPRSAGCRTNCDTECLSLHADAFNSLIVNHPEVAGEIMKRMLAITAGRLVTIGSFLSQMVQWGESSRKRAITDPATGLFNRRYMDDSFESLFTRAKTEGRSLTYVMFDMDHFGSLNAKYGLEFGDKVIIRASDVFKSVFRTQDILVRYGGDEFIFILPDAGRTTAQSLCDNLCAAMRALRFDIDHELRLTCSMGFASFPSDANVPDELREKADKALYRAKENGRDRAMGA
ncbi:MAG TPA: GGDEF domain-containing protein [Spirochaetota bacterium]